MSLMKILNKRRPLIDPCGTARRILQHSLKLLFTLTLWNHFGKSLWTNFIALKSHTHIVLASNKLWLSVSNALGKSINRVTIFLHNQECLWWLWQHWSIFWSIPLSFCFMFHIPGQEQPRSLGDSKPHKFSNPKKL